MMKARKLSAFITLCVAFAIACSTNHKGLFKLTIEPDYPEGGTVSPEQGEYDAGTEVKITALPDEHWYFDGWEGDYTGSDNPATVTMDSDKIITARFLKRDYPLTVEIIGEGMVTEQVVQQKTTEYPYETVVELTPIPSNGWEFVKWKGDLPGSDIPKQVSITSEMNITAVFEFDLGPAEDLTRILTNDNGDGTFSDNEFEAIVGIEVIDETLRMYYRVGTFGGIFFMETTDMINWTDPTEVQLPSDWYGLYRLGIFYHDGWKGYGSDDGIYLFTSTDGIEFDLLGKAFDWKSDTFYSFFFDKHKDKYVAYGRVRGTGIGGWQDDMDPDIDRRGISFHSNKDWTPEWLNQGQIIIDPKDFWDYNKEFIPDFYIPNIYWDEDKQKYLSLSAVLWREKNRLITDYLGFQNNTRTTGEVYPIVMESYDGINFSIVSEESVVPLAPHRRYGYTPPWRGESSNTEPTCPDCYEVGQIYPFIRPVQFKGSMYIFYAYKDHTHYEKPNYKNVEHSIYVLKL